MCLYSNRKNFKKAKEDIICYKVLKVIRTFFGYTFYATPYMNKPVPKLGVEMKDDECLDAKKYPNISSKYMISAGGFHTFKNFDDAKDELKWHLDNCGKEYIIVKSIIPKGSSYIEGTFENTPAYVSKRIIYQEILK